MGLPEKDHVDNRCCDLPSMGSLDGSDVLGLREGRHRVEGSSFRTVPVGSSRGHHPGRQ